MTQIKIINTKDGSNTLYRSDIDESYHSTFGALSESMHVFIEAGYKSILKDQINILEIGYGTGLNAYLTLLESIKSKQKIFYHGIELFPVSKEIWETLTYSSLLEDKFNLFEKINSASWEKQHIVESSFSILKTKSDFTKTKLYRKYDLIYFDAFSPDSQPEMWSTEQFIKLYNCLNPTGVLTTYSSKGIVKQALKKAGFVIQRLPGPEGKRHMLKAIKK